MTAALKSQNCSIVEVDMTRLTANHVLYFLTPHDPSSLNRMYSIACSYKV